MECDVAAVAAAVFFDGFGIVPGIIAPAGEVGRAGLVAQRAEYRIGQEPVRVGLHEIRVVAACGDVCAVAFESASQQAQFVVVDPFVVDLRQGVQFVAQAAVFIVLLDACIGQVEKLRMQGECRIGVIGVGVLPRSAHRGVVDRKQLEHALSGRRGPVGQAFQVAKLPDAEIFLRAQRKDGNGRACPAPPAFGKPGHCRGVDEAFAVAGYFAPYTVGSLLPCDGFEGLAVGQQEFVFEAIGGLQQELPLREMRVVHRHYPLPAAQFRAAAGDGEDFVRPQDGLGDAQDGVCRGVCRRSLFSFCRLPAAEYAPGKCR